MRVFQVKLTKWTDFGSDVQEKLNAARESQERTVRYMRNDKEYEIDLVDMVVRNLASGRELPVQEIEEKDSSDWKFAEVKKFFRAFDWNNDEHVSRKEMVLVLTGLDPRTFSKESVLEMFDLADTDHDHKVSMEEFVNWLMAGGEGATAVTSTLAETGHFDTRK
eukprot:TRINITY_DN41187_c0_g1_i1.p1 TRINITY_DN41187_c0_g1~~TRINITY_DN41187_c0_g1_i1.p1  ORF type:complete len:164 (+),score=35.08 TRINITY_DN41187_c0_g1_i1:82-573(+)